MVELCWVTVLLGGVVIVLSATLLLAFNGRSAGISGIVNGAIQGNETWHWLFLLGMILGGMLYEYGLATRPTPTPPLTMGSMIVGGFLVGFGTHLGNGCTSGHGVCGLGRLSLRSLIAVLTFLATAMVTVWITRYGAIG